MRATLAVLAAAAVGALGALILGEYPFNGLTILAAGLVFGLFIAEAAVAINRQATRPLGATVAVIGLAAMTWAGWITTFHDLGELSGKGWASIALCGLAGGLRAGLAPRLRGETSRRAPDSPDPAPAPAPSTEDRAPS